MKKSIHDKSARENPITTISELNDYWDVEDRLYEQQKENKIDNILDESMGD